MGPGGLTMKLLGGLQTPATSPRSSKARRDEMLVNAQALRKKLSRTCDEGARALLSSLLVYVSDSVDGPQRAEDKGHRPGGPPLPQEAGQRPTRFQLLQAKFMGRGREHHFKRTREVGRLISRDKQSPGRSLVSATINKLLEKTKEGASSSSQRPLAGEKPCGGTGKSTVKDILRKFLAAEEKETKEQDTGEKLPARRPGAARGLLPKIVGRSTILSKLRERFEQSSCLHSEAGLLPLHREARKSKGQQKKMHKHEVRMLHTATMATSCTRTPPARFLACTAEPLPALSIATVVCSPRSWLSHCAKIRHLDSRRWPRRDAGMTSNSGDTEPCRDKTPGKGPLSEEPRGQQKPSQSLTPQVAIHGNSCMALNATESIAQQASSWASCEGKAFPGYMPLSSPFRPASPRGTRPAEPTAKGPAGHIWGLKEGTGEVPEVTMAVTSYADEEESAPPASHRGPLFATQRHVTEQEAATQIPPLAVPAVQAARRAQPALHPPHITLQLPIVHEIPDPPEPLLSTSAEDRGPRTWGRDAAAADVHVACPPATEDRRDCQDPSGLSRPCGTPANLRTASEQGPQGALGDAAPRDCGGPQTFLTLSPLKSTPGGKGHKHSLVGSSDSRNLRASSGQGIPELRCWTHPSPESKQILTPKPGASSDPSPSASLAWKSPPEGSTCATPGSQQAPAPSEGGSTTALAQGFRGPGSPTGRDRSILCREEQCKGPPTEPAPPLRIFGEEVTCGLSKNRLSSLEEGPKTSGKASKGTAAGGKVPSPTAPPSGGAWVPKVKTAPQPEGIQDPKGKTAPPPGGAQDPKGKAVEECTALDGEEHRAPLWSARHSVAKENGLMGENPAQELSNYHSLAPSGSSKHKSGAAAGSIGEDRALQLSPAQVPLTAGPEASDSPLALAESQLCAPNACAVVTGHRDGSVAGRGPRHSGTTPRVQPPRCPTPHRSPAESQGMGQSQRPSADAQAQDRRGLQPAAHMHPAAAPAPACLTGPAPEQEAKWAEQRAAPKTESPEPTRAGVGRPESILRPEGSVTGHEREHQTRQPDSSGSRGEAPSSEKVELRVRDPWALAAQDLAGGQKATVTEKPHQPSTKGRQARSPAQEEGLKASKGPAAPSGTPRGSCRLAAQDQGQVWEQPDTTAEGTPAEGTSRESPRLPPRLSGQRSPRTPRPLPGSGALTGKSAAASALEPMDSCAAQPTPDAGGCLSPQAPVQQGLWNSPEAQRDLSEGESHRRPVSLAKYKAQSFSDQRAFDLSFRPTLLRASDTFQAPK